MVFAFRLIKWTEMKNVTVFLWLRSFTASRPGTHIVSISGGSVHLGTVESYGRMAGLRQLKWSTLCSYSALSKSMRLVYICESDGDLLKWTSQLDIVHFTSSRGGKLASTPQHHFEAEYVRMDELAFSGGQEQHVSVNIAERKSSI